jgi:D-glycero-alpha-D-manno-heptose-7-phosphate kinase
VEQVYENHATPQGKAALAVISACGKAFFEALSARDFLECAAIMDKNFQAQKRLAPASSNEYLEELYSFAKQNGACGGKICGAGGGGAFIFYCKDPSALATVLKKRFVDCFEIDFDIEYSDIKKLNNW